MVEATAYGIEDIGADGKVHIGDPHRLQVVTAPTWQQGLMHEVPTAAAFYFR